MRKILAALILFVFLAISDARAETRRFLVQGPVATGLVCTTCVDATDIASDAVTEPKLKAVDAAADEECLTYETTTGDFEWQACGGGLIDLTTGVVNVLPQANGGILTINATDAGIFSISIFHPMAQTNSAAHTANRVYVYSAYVPFYVTITESWFYLNAIGAAGCKYNTGIYDSTGNTLITSGSTPFDCTAGNGAAHSLTQSATLSPGYYLFTETTNDTTASLVVVHNLPSQGGNGILNALGATALVGYCTNTSTAGAFPATCGTITADATSPARTPIIAWYGK